MTNISDLTDIARAVNGDRAAFDELVSAERGKLRGVIRRLVGHPEDTDDLVQEATLRAWQAIGDFRSEAGFGTWLCSIGIRCAIDHLRQQQRWRPRAQVIYANECDRTEALAAEVGAAVMAPDFSYDAHEHIAYCFSCVGRSLPTEQHAALVLREVFEMTNREAATELGMSESVLRHTLAEARAAMQQTFDGLCSLVNKQGVCYQCAGLRECTPEERRGGEIPTLVSFEARIAAVRQGNVDAGASQSLHDLFWRRTKQIEDSGVGDADAPPSCS